MQICRGVDDASSTTSHGNIGNRILSTFLNELDGVGSHSIKGLDDAASMVQSDTDEQVVFVAVSCSDIEKLDEALIRPGYVI